MNIKQLHDKVREITGYKYSTVKVETNHSTKSNGRLEYTAWNGVYHVNSETVEGLLKALKGEECEPPIEIEDETLIELKSGIQEICEAYDFPDQMITSSFLEPLYPVVVGILPEDSALKMYGKMYENELIDNSDSDDTGFIDELINDFCEPSKSDEQLTEREDIDKEIDRSEEGSTKEEGNYRESNSLQYDIDSDEQFPTFDQRKLEPND